LIPCKIICSKLGRRLFKIPRCSTKVNNVRILLPHVKRTIKKEKPKSDNKLPQNLQRLSGQLLCQSPLFENLEGREGQGEAREGG